MPKFMIAYVGGTQPETPEEGAEQMAKWKAWVAGLGDAVVNPGTPLKQTVRVTQDGEAPVERANSLTGFSVVATADMAAALDIAKSCPFLAFGEIDVSEMIEMQM